MARTRVPEASLQSPSVDSAPKKAGRRGAPAPVIEVPTVVTPRRVSHYLIANQHTAPILLLRRSSRGGLSMAPRTLWPGTVTTVDAEEWVKNMKNAAVQMYVDRGLLREVEKMGPVPVLDSTTSDLPIPEHLQTAAELADTQRRGTEIGGTIGAGLRRAQGGSVNV